MMATSVPLTRSRNVLLSPSLPFHSLSASHRISLSFLSSLPHVCITVSACQVQVGKQRLGCCISRSRSLKLECSCLAGVRRRMIRRACERLISLLMTILRPVTTASFAPSFRLPFFLLDIRSSCQGLPSSPISRQTSTFVLLIFLRLPAS